jgi:ribonuclease T2
MNPRLSLTLVALVLLAGALYLLLQPQTTNEPPAGQPPPVLETQPSPAASDEFFILAVSWQPAFCEGASGKPECRSQTRDRFDASHFTLHGLWPEDEYCGVSRTDENLDRDGSWSDLPEVRLSTSLRRQLDTAMPGTASQLDRHEYLKHGTCFDGSAETYFAAALSLLEQLNASPVRDLFAENVGRRLTQRQLRAAFDRGFGKGIGQRVRLTCDNDGDRTLVSELTLGLWGVIDAEPDLAALLAAARPTSGGCDSGIVDAVGRQ